MPTSAAHSRESAENVRGTPNRRKIVRRNDTPDAIEHIITFFINAAAPAGDYYVCTTDYCEIEGESHAHFSPTSASGGFRFTIFRSTKVYTSPAFPAERYS